MVGFVQLILLLLKLCDIYLSYRVLEQTETKGLYLRLTGPHDGIFFSRLFILLLNPPQSKKKKNLSSRSSLCNDPYSVSVGGYWCPNVKRTYGYFQSK